MKNNPTRIKLVSHGAKSFLGTIHVLRQQKMGGWFQKKTIYVSISFADIQYVLYVFNT